MQLLDSVRELLQAVENVRPHKKAGWKTAEGEGMNGVFLSSANHERKADTMCFHSENSDKKMLFRPPERCATSS